MPLIFYTCALLCLLVALKQARSLKSTPAQLMFFVAFAAAASLVGYQLLIGGNFAEVPQIFMLINLFPLLAVQAMYFYARYLVDIRFKLRLSHLAASGLVAAAYTAILIPYWQLPAAEKIEIIREIITRQTLYSSRDPLLFGASVLKVSNIYFGITGVVTFLFACALIVPQAIRPGTRSKPVFFAAMFYLLCLMLAVVGTFSVAVNSFPLLVGAGVIMGLAFGGLYFIGEFFPWAIYENKIDIAPDVEQGGDPERRTYLKTEDISRLASSISEAMEAKRIFKDPDLSLVSAAALLEVTPHQLSEYLNRQLGKRFTRFINEYRIREAIRMLEAEQGETVRAIGRAVGFDNEAYFSHIFLTETGTRPSDYRLRRARA